MPEKAPEDTMSSDGVERDTPGMVGEEVLEPAAYA